MGDIELNKIHCMDCLEGMKELPDNSVDLVITSPPYNAGNNVRGNFYKEYSDNLEEEKYKEWIYNCLNEMIRVTKHYVFFNFQILTNNKSTYLDFFKDYNKNIKDIIIWHKSTVQPSIVPTRLNSAFEFIVVLSKEDKCKSQTFERAFFNNRKKGQLNNNVIYGLSSSSEYFEGRKEHKAIYPEYLVEDLLNKFSDTNDIILDPFMGSGTTAVACKTLNRKYIGFEISEEYCKIAEESRTNSW